MNNRILARLVLTTSLLLPLAACGTGGGDLQAANGAQIDAALAQAQTEAAGSGDTEQSLLLQEQIYKRDTGNADTALKYATALQDNGHGTRAAPVLAPFIKDGRADHNVPLLTEYATIEATLGHYTAAENAARKAVNQDPENGQAYHILGIALDADGDHPDAENAFRRALKNWKGDPSPVLNNLGLNLAVQGFIDEAVSMLQKAATLSPDRAEIQRNLKIVLALQKQPGAHLNKRVGPANATNQLTPQDKAEPVVIMPATPVKPVTHAPLHDTFER